MTTAQFLALFLVWIAAIASPGPDLFQIIRLGAKNRRDGILTAVGIMVGNSIWIIASLLGLSALISTYPAILNVLQIVGGGYLTWMGIGAVRSWWKQRSTQQSVADSTAVESALEAPSNPSVGVWPAIRSGIATNLSNPKAVLFFGSVFAQFIRPDMGVGWSAFIGALLIVTGLLWFIGFAVLVRKLAASITRNGAIIDLITGVIFISLGMFMIFEGVVGIGGRVVG
ncbi:threonine efflux protein [Corynebacterium suranareeae]|uniref:Threonine efflux protein n=1 Tax=Corynebacterium suranareeae TaxID=2506452 RepID=A0A160PNT5_9CORY|nr:LysE family translocator [Corynebacterium suranareeae]BAU94513.1 threonine efflux protein [Corynebacterium suranareeae]